MVAIITGRGVGLERSSALVLGSRGQLGAAAMGRDGEGVYVNAASGNLVITRQDEFLIGLGADISINRTYNSQASISDGDNNDNWRMSPYRKVTGLSGTYGAAGTTVKRIDWDGSDTLYTWNATYTDGVTTGFYVATDGAGAYDTLKKSGSTWTWTDGDSQVTESYDDNNGGRITATIDTDGNSVGYAYNGAGQISRVTSYNAIGTADDDWTDFSYSGTLLTQLVTSKGNGAGGSLTRVRYTYLTADGTNRLATVTVDLSPNDSAIGDSYTYATTYTYDGTSTRVASITQQDGSSVSFSYVQVGADYKVASFTQTVAAGVSRSTSFDYSVAGRTTVIDPAGQKTILWYNGNNELTQISYPPEDVNTTPKVVQFGYDVSGDGDVTSMMLGPGNVVAYDYDPHGNRKLERDSAGNTIARTFSPKNELLTETRYVVPDPDGAGSGPPTTPLTTRFAYDGESHLRYIVSAEGFVTQYEYDTPGRQTAANEYVANAYNLAGLADNVSIAESTLTTWVSALDKTGSRRTETAYDYRGNIATVTSYSKLLSNGLFDTSSELSQTNYVYDQYGMLLNRTVTGSAGSEVFVYDGLGRATQATDFNGNVTRTTFLDVTGQTVLTHANGLSEVSTYNKAGELIAYSKSEAGGNLVDLTGWPGNPTSPPSGQATVPGWQNWSAYTDETQWATTTGPDGVPVVAIRAGQTDMGQEGGGNATNVVTIDPTKAYEFTYYFKITDLDKHYVFFGLNGNSAVTVENMYDGADNANPYFYYAIPGSQASIFTADKWYKLVGYVLPQGTPTNSAALGGVYDATTGQKVAENYLVFRWNDTAPTTAYARFFDYYGEANQQYSTYFYQPEIRQVTAPGFTGPDTATSLYRYDSLGRLRMTIDPTGRRNYMLYDSIGRKVADVDSDGSVIEYRYDGNDNLTSSTRYATKLDANQIAALAVFDGGGGSLTVGPTGSSLMTNGSFDLSGAYTTTTYGRSNTDLPGWTKTNPETFEQVAAGQLGVTGTNGAYWLDLDSVPGTGTIPTGSNLVVNGSFDTSGSYSTLAYGRSNTDLPGWTKTNPETFEQVASGQLGVTGTDGSYWLDLDSVPGSGYAPVGANLLSNGSFDTSGSYTSLPHGRINPTLPGWSKTNAEDFEQVSSGQFGVTGTDGAYWLDLDSYVAGALVPVGSNLLTNGSFETSAASYTTLPQGRSSLTLPGWVKYNADPGRFEQVTSTQFGVTASDGNFWLDLDGINGSGGGGPNTLMDIRQTVGGLAAGQTMLLQFDHANRTTSTNGAFEVYWNNALIATISETGTTMTAKSYQLTAIAGNNVVRFKSLGTGSDAIGASLDNVRLFATQQSVSGGNMDISQTVGGLSAGQVMQIQFDYANRTTSASGSFEVYWNGTLIDTVTSTGATMQGKTYQVAAVAGNNTLRFKGTGTVDASGASIDNVRLYATQPIVGGGNMDISQTIGGLSAGQVMQLQFDHANRTTSGSGSFEVYWNGALVDTITATGATMQTKTYLVSAVAGNNVLRFKATGTVDAAGASIDNVRLFATTTPVGGGNMDISQTIGGLAAGQVMQLQFDHANRTGGASGNFEVYWNNSLIATITDTGSAMQTKTYNVTAVAGNNTIRFKGIGTVDANGASIDNVRLFATGMIANPGSLGAKLADIRPLANANDAWTFQMYDAAQRLIQTIDGTGATTVLAYDGASRLTSTTSYANRLSAATLTALKAEASNPNLWANPSNGALWAYYNLTEAAAAPIDGANAYQFTIQASSWEAVVGNGLTNAAGDIVSVTLSMKAVGTTTTNSFGLAGSGSGWGLDYANPDARGAIVSGPGTFVQFGSHFYIDGLSTTEATRFTITRTLPMAETTNSYLYVRTGATFDGAAGASTILAAPVMSRLHASPYYLPTTDAANDRVSRNFYDKDGRLIGALDGEGNFTETVYDKGGRKIRSIAYAAATTASLRASGTFAQLRASAIQNGSANLWASPNDAAGWAGWGLQAPQAAGTIDGYNAFKLTIAQTGSVGAVYNWTSGIAAGETTSLALSVMAVGAQTSITLGPAGYNGQWSWGADDYSTVQIVSGPGTAARITGAMWTISGLSTTEATRFIITKRATGAQDEVPHVYIGYYTQQAGDALILSNPVFSRGNPADIETNYVYDSRGMLRATVDGEGGLTRYRYTALGDVDQEISGQKLAAADLPLTGLKFPSLPAAPGGSILKTISYTRDLYGKALTETVSLTGGTTTTVAHAYDVMGRLVATTTQSGGADPRTASQRFDLRGRLIGELGGIGNASLPGSPTQAQIDQAYASYGISHAYDAADRMISSTDARGARSLYYYDTDGRMAFQVDPLGEVAEYRYDALGQGTDVIVYATRIGAATLAGMTGGNVTAGVAATMAALANAALDSASHMDFNVDGSVMQSSDPLANLTTYSYNAFGELIADIVPRDGAATIQTSRSYDRRGLLKTAIVDSAGGGKAITTSYGYDAFGRAVTLTNALNKVASSTYDRKGRVTSTTDAVNAVTSYAYDARDNLVAVTDALGKITRIVYDKANRKIATIDALGEVTATTYDADGRAVATRAYFNTVNIAGLPLEVTESALALPATNAADHVTRYAYDKDGQLRFTVDGLMHVVENVYDVVGNVIRTVAYDGTIATDGTGVYSASWIAGQVAGLAGAAGTRTTRAVYDVANRLIYSVDALGQATWITYDAKGQIIKQVQLATLYTAGGDPSLSTMDSWRAGNGNPTYDRTTRAYYDRKGRQSYSIDALGYVTRFEYDKLGNIKKQSRYADAYGATDATTLANLDSAFASPPATARITLFNYDSAGRLEETIDPEGYSTKLVLDQLGQVTSSTAAFGLSAASVTTYSYDDVGRMLTETRGYGSAEASVTAFVYDALGQLTQRTAANGTGDASISKWEYDALGRATKQTRGFGTAEIADTLIGYDSFGRAISTTDPRGSVVSRVYNIIDNLLSETEQLEVGTTDDQVTTYTYDSFGDAVKVRDARDNDSFTYFDKLGRAVRQVDAEKFVTDTTYTRGGKIATLKLWANRATGTIVETSMPADPAADTSHDAITIFTYNNRDELTAVQDAGGYTESYVPNAFGDRISLTNKLYNTITYTFDKRGLLLSETLPITTKNAGGATISVVNSYAYDARGNRTQTIEAAGAAEARTTSYAYDKLDRLITTTRDVVTIVNDDLTSSNVTPTETLKYDRRGNVIESIDAGGARTLFWYDDLDRAIWQVSQTDKVTLQGTLTRTFYDGNGNVTSTKAYGDLIALPADATGAAPTPYDANNFRLVSYVYDRSNRRTTATIAALRTGAFSGSSYTTTFSGDVTTTLYYDKAGNAITEGDGNGNGTWVWYDKLGRTTAQVDREYYLTVWTRDAEGNVLSETRYATQVGSFSYGPNPPSVGTSAADRTTTFSYDKNGRRLTESRSGVAYGSIGGTGALTTGTAASTVTYTYNGLGEVLTRSEANNDLTGYTYDAIGRLTLETGQSFTDYQSASVTPRTAYAYDGLNNLKSTRIQMGAAANDTNDHITSYTYGAGGRLATMTDAAGFVHSYGYDAAGRTVRDSYARLKADGVTSVTEAQITRYDLAGRAIVQTSARFNGSAWVFTDLAGAAYDAVRIRYNAYGEIAGRGLTAGPGATAVYQEVFDYDEGGRLWRSTEGDGTIKILFYDRSGNTTLTLSSTGADLAGQTYASAMATLTAAGGTTIANAVTTIGVFDRRGQQIQTREPGRQISAATTTELVHARTYNAFGEVSSETDARGYATSFTYNTMGRLLSKVSPQVNVTAENGGISTVNPTEYYNYDLSGRRLSIDDANGNRTTRELLAGSGHGDAGAIVTKEFHPDGGMFESKYDVFGAMRASVNEIGKTETFLYDKMNRLTEQQHQPRPAGTPGNSTGAVVQLIDYYAYDGLGQRTQHWNSQLTASVKELTDYDAQGRVSATVALGGDSTSYTYAWNASQTTNGLGTFGAWTKVALGPDGHSQSEVLDYFGRTIDRIDAGGHDYDLTFDKGGRLISQAIVGAATTSMSWYNSGLLASQSASGLTAAYGYDENGRRTTESYGAYQNATVTWDAMGRMTTFSDTGAVGGTAPATIAYEYDAVGNVRRMAATYANFDAQGVIFGSGYPQEYWYRYDNMNRFVATQAVFTGTRGSGSIVGGTQISYDAAGNRATATLTASRTKLLHKYVPSLGPPTPRYYDDDANPITPDDGGGTWSDVQYPFFSGQVETYSYTADGYLAGVSVAVQDLLPTGDLGKTNPPVGPLGASVPRGSYELDAMGRVTAFSELNAAGASVYSRASTYNAKSQVTHDVVNTSVANTSGGTDLMATTTDYYYTTGAGAYLGGSIDHYVAATTKSGVLQSTLTTTNAYDWWSGPRQSSSTAFTHYSVGGPDTTYVSTYSYDGLGHLSSAYVPGGRARTVTFVTDIDGRVLDRDENDNQTGGDPRELHYYFNGTELGGVSNNGTTNVDYVSAIALQTATPGTGPFQGGSANSTNYVDFDQSYNPINGLNGASTGSSYTVNQGDTLQSIALAIWGDGALWYLIADANGLTGNASLVAGATLAIPNKVTNFHNSADTFKVYDPNKALGDLSPTAPKPPKAHKGCGMLGAILLVAIAVAVTIVTSGAAIAALAPASAGMSVGMGISVVMGTAAAGVSAGVGLGTMIVAGAIGGAVGSIVSQGIGVATGLQDKFSWKGVAMSALSGAIGAGLGKFSALSKVGSAGPGVAKIGGTLGKIGQFLGKGNFIAGATRGVLSSALAQGIGVATGLQKSFDWVGVAAAGVGGGVSNALGARMNGWDPQAAQLVSGAAGAVANAAARTVLNGSSFGDNILAALPDVIGTTIGNMIAGGLAAAPFTGSTDYDGDGILGPSEESDTYLTQLAAAKSASLTPTSDKAASIVQKAAAGANGFCGTGGPGDPFTVRGEHHTFEFSENGSGTTLNVILAGADDPTLLLDLANQLYAQNIPIQNTIDDLIAEIDSLDPTVRLTSVQNAYNSLNGPGSRELSEHPVNTRLDELINEFNLQIAMPLIVRGYIYAESDLNNPVNHTTYTIQRGDTLSKIAARLNGLSTDFLASHNNISNPDRIRVGTTIIIPTQEYIATLARRYQVFLELVDPYVPPPSAPPGSAPASGPYGRFGSMTGLQQAAGTEYQRLVDIGFRRGTEFWDAMRLGGLNQNQAIGRYMDDFARIGMRNWFEMERIQVGPEGPAQVYVNARLYDRGGFRYRIPDLRVGDRYFDASLAPKSESTRQIRDFYGFGNPSMVTINRPTSWGGAYDIPRPTGVRPVIPGRTTPGRPVPNRTGR